MRGVLSTVYPGAGSRMMVPDEEPPDSAHVSRSLKLVKESGPIHRSKCTAWLTQSAQES